METFFGLEVAGGTNDKPSASITPEERWQTGGLTFLSAFNDLLLNEEARGINVFVLIVTILIRIIVKMLLLSIFGRKILKKLHLLELKQRIEHMRLMILYLLLVSMR